MNIINDNILLTDIILDPQQILFVGINQDDPENSICVGIRDQIIILEQIDAAFFLWEMFQRKRINKTLGKKFEDIIARHLPREIIDFPEDDQTIAPFNQCSKEDSSS